jgi:hypothetical protein
MIPNCSKNLSKTVVDMTSDEMGMGAVQALFEFSLLVFQQNHSELSFTALENALKRVHKTRVIFMNTNY